jgi:hypothetical protein
MKSRVLAASAVALALVGCSSQSSVYGVVVEDATVSESADAAGWCGDGSTPTISVVVNTAHTRGETSTDTEPVNPSWFETVLVAKHGELAHGLRADVFGHCGGETIHFGAARFVPSSEMFSGRTIVLQGLGAVSELRVHFQWLEPVSSGGGGYYFEGGYYEDGGSYYDDGTYGSGSYTCYDDGTCVDDGSDDWGDDGWEDDSDWDDDSDYDDSDWDDDSDWGDDSGSDDSGSDDSGSDDGDWDPGL